MANESKVSIIIEGKNQAASAFKQVDSQLTSLQASVAGLVKGAGLAALAAGLLEVGRAAFALGKEAAGVMELRGAFDSLAAGVGQSGDKMLAAMRTASAGLISDAQLVGTANKAILMGVADNADEMASLMEVALARGDAMGLSAATAADMLTEALGRMSGRAMAGLGIMIEEEQIFTAYAQSLGRTAESLSDVEKKQALVNEVIASSASLVADAAARGDSYADSFERMDAASKNAKQALGEVFAEDAAKAASNYAILLDKIAAGLLQIAAAREGASFGDMEAAWAGLASSGAEYAEQQKVIVANQSVVNATLVEGAAAANTLANQMARTAIISAQIATERGDPDAAFRARLGILQRTTQATKDANAEVGRDNERLAAEMSSAYGRAASDTQSAWESAFDALKSKVSSVLSGALNVDVGVNADDLLPREDAINEDARRLADVAVNGFASPWADYLNNKFPGMFGEAFEGGDIKTKAAQLLKDFEDGLNPQLIDKDKAKERVKRMILGDASMAELAAQVTAELQAEMGGNAPADLAAKVQQALGGTGSGGAETGANFAGTTLDAIVTSDVGGNMVATVVNQAAGKAALVKASGESSGKLWGTSVLTGAQQAGVPEGLITLLIGFLWPAVLAKMAEQKTKTGTVEAQ